MISGYYFSFTYALIFQAAIILSLQAKAWDYWYKKYLNHIHTNCSPSFKYYDDDDLPMPVQNGNQLQETTARNKVSCISKLFSTTRAQLQLAIHKLNFLMPVQLAFLVELHE